MASAPATITAVSCISACAGAATAQSGSLLRIRGTAMSAVRKIVFLGAGGNRDNLIADTLKWRPTSVDVIVPARAASGRLRAVNGDGQRSTPSRATVSITSAPVSTGPLDVQVVGRRVFLGSQRPAQLNLMAREPMSVSVALVRIADGAAVMSWPVAAPVPGVVQTVTWDGRLAGIAQPPGRYEFRVFGAGVAAQAAQAAQAPAALATVGFELVDHKFPVQGKHNFGQAEARFGAGRSGHVHQGQDVLAACGTPLVAARGGVIKLNQHHERAGNYLVIDGDGIDIDYVYMHLREPSPLQKGARVLTGQAIGNVGRTGSATACHLHFELWSAPGWYTGGTALDPLPVLQLWDAYS